MGDGPWFAVVRRRGCGILMHWSMQLLMPGSDHAEGLHSWVFVAPEVGDCMDGSRVYGKDSDLGTLVKEELGLMDGRD